MLQILTKQLIGNVGNGQYCSFFVIPVTVNIRGHIVEIYTLFSEIYDNLNLAIGLKGMHKFEGYLFTQDLCFRFLRRSVPLYLIEKVILKPQ